MTGNKPRSTLSFMKQKVQSPNQMNKNISLSLKQRKNNCCLPSRSSFSFRPPPFTAQPCEWNLKMFTQFVHHTFSFKDLDEQVAIYMAKNRQLKAVNLKRLSCWLAKVGRNLHHHALFKHSLLLPRHFPAL